MFSVCVALSISSCVFSKSELESWPQYRPFYDGKNPPYRPPKGETTAESSHPTWRSLSGLPCGRSPFRRRCSNNSRKNAVRIRTPPYLILYVDLPFVSVAVAGVVGSGWVARGSRRGCGQRCVYEHVSNATYCTRGENNRRLAFSAYRSCATFNFCSNGGKQGMHQATCPTHNQ